RTELVNYAVCPLVNGPSLVPRGDLSVRADLVAIVGHARPVMRRKATTVLVTSYVASEPVLAALGMVRIDHPRAEGACHRAKNLFIPPSEALEVELNRVLIHIPCVYGRVE